MMDSTQQNALPSAETTRVTPLNIDAPVILLVGKTGAGKSTLGNLLMLTSEEDNPTFYVSDNFESVTKKSGSAVMEIDGQYYNIVDTPGIFDTKEPDNQILEEIARTIQKCVFGIKAILFVFEAKRFTPEQQNVINGIKMFLGEDALQYMIAVFSHCNKIQTEETTKLKESWNTPVRAFVNSIGNRWAVSPNPELFPPNDLVHQQRLGELQDMIGGMEGKYTNELLEKARKKQKEIERAKEEADRKSQEERNMAIRRAAQEAAAIEYENKLQEQVKSLTTELQNVRNSHTSTTCSSQPKGQPKERCFLLETKVKLESGRIIPMSELQVGDRVFANVKNGVAEFSDVYLIAHIGKLQHEAKFTKVSFTRPDGFKGQLRLTSTHYVFKEDLSIAFAKDLRPRETKILIFDDDKKLVPIIVDDISTEWHDGYISFYTRAGSVIADGVLCSCYDHCPPSQMLMDLVFLPVRWWSLITPIMHREERLHPYVQFLETTYLWFVNSMKQGKRLICN